MNQLLLDGRVAIITGPVLAIDGGKLAGAAPFRAVATLSAAR